MSKRFGPIGLAAAFLAALILVVVAPARESAARPQYAQQHNLQCASCHTQTAPVKLTAFGLAFQRNGHRIPDGLQPPRGTEKVEADHRLVLVPREDIEVLFAKGRPGLFKMAYTDFLNLLARAAEKSSAVPPTPVIPGRDYVITRANYTLTHASPQSSQVEGTATFEILSTTDQETLCAIGLRQVSVASATLDGEDALIVARGGIPHVRLARAGTHTLKIAFAIKTPERKNTRSVVLDLAPATAGGLIFTAGGEAKVTTRNVVVIQTESDKAGGTVTKMALTKGNKVVLTWEYAKKKERLDQRVAIRESTLYVGQKEGLSVTAQFSTAGLASPVRSLTINAPESLSVSDITGNGAKPRLWKQDGDKITVYFSPPVGPRFTLKLTGQLRNEKGVYDIPNLKIAAIETENGPATIERQSGVVSLAKAEGLKIAFSSEQNLTRTNVSRGSEKTFAQRGANRIGRSYLYWRLPFALKAAFSAVEPKPTARVTYRLYNTDHRLHLSAQISYIDEESDTFRVTASLPADWEIVSVAAREPDGRQVDWEQTVRDGRRILTVPLRHKIPRRQTYALHFAARRSLTGWSGDDAWTSEPTKTLSLPEIHAQDVVTETGEIAVDLKSSLQVVPEALESLETAPTAALSDRAFIKSDRGIGFRYEGDAYEATLKVSRKEPQVTVETFNTVSTNTQLVTTHATVLYDIKNRKIRRLFLKLPPESGQQVNIQGHRKTEKGFASIKFAGQPTIVSEAEDANIWQVKLEQPAEGLVSLLVDFKVDIGTEKKRFAAPVVSVPLQPPTEQAGAVEVLSISGKVTLEAGDYTETVPHPEGLHRIALSEAKSLYDQPQFPIYTPRNPILFAYAHVSDQYKLDIEIQRHEDLAVPEAIVQHARLQTNVTASGKANTRAVYRILGRAKQFLTVAAPSGFELWSATVNEQPTKVNRTADGRLLIPLRKTEVGQAEAMVVLQFSHTLEALSASGTLTARAPQIDIMVNRLTWQMNLPETYRYTSFSGNTNVPAIDRPKLAVESLLSSLSLDVPFGGEKREDTATAPPAGASEKPDEKLSQFGYAADRQEPPVLPSAEESTRVNVEAERPDNLERVYQSGEPGKKAPIGGSVQPHVLGQFTSHGAAFHFDRVGDPASGEPPTLEIAYAKDRPMNRLTVLAGVLTFAVGCALRRARVHALAFALIACTLFSILPGLIGEAYTAVCNSGFHWALYYLAAMAAYALVRSLGRGAKPAATAAMLLIVLIPVVAMNAQAGPVPGVGKEELEIYVPYDPTVEPEDVNVDQVYVPYNEYMRLWQIAHPNQPQTAPKVPYGISNADYRIAFGAKTVTVHATYKLYVFQDKETSVGLAFGGAALEAATLNGNAATLSEKGGQTSVVVHEKGTYELALRLSVPYGQKAQSGSFRLAIPAVPASRAEIALPHPDSVLTVSSARGGQRTEAGKVIAALGATASLDVQWKPKTGTGRGATLRYTAWSNTDLHIGLDRTRVHQNVSYTIRGGTLDRMELAVPRGLAIRSVNGADIKEWNDVEEAGVEAGFKKVTVILAKPAAKAYALTIVGEVGREGPEGLATLPAIRPLGTVRETGRVNVYADALVTATVNKMEGLRRENITGRRVTFDTTQAYTPRYSFLYSKRPITLEMKTAFVRPKVTATVGTHLTVEDDELVGETLVTFQASQGGPYTYAVAFPEGVRIDDVKIQKGRWKEWHEEKRDGKRLVVVDFATQATGTTQLRIAFHHELASDVNAFQIPRIEPLDVESVKGQIAIAPAKGIHIKAFRDPINLSAIPAHKLSMIPSALVPRPQTARSFAFDQTPYGGTLVIERLAAITSAEVFTNVVVNDATVETAILISFTVKNKPLDRFEVSLPSALEKSVRFDLHPMIQSTPSRINDAGDTVTWTLVLKGPVPRFMPIIAFEQKIANNRIPVQRIGLSGVQARSDFVMVQNDSAAELRKTTNRLEEIPTSAVPLRAASDPGLVKWTFRGMGSWSLELETIRHEQVQEAPASIEFARIVSVIQRDGATLNRAAYTMLVRSQQYLALQLPAQARIISASVEGRPVKPVETSGKMLIPLIRAPRRAPCSVVLTYAANLPDFESLDDEIRPIAPKVVDTYVRRTAWHVQLPKGYDYNADDASNVAPTQSVASRAEEKIALVAAILDSTEQVGKRSLGNRYDRLREEEESVRNQMTFIGDATDDVRSWEDDDKNGKNLGKEKEVVTKRLAEAKSRLEKRQREIVALKNTLSAKDGKGWATDNNRTQAVKAQDALRTARGFYHQEQQQQAEKQAEVIMQQIGSKDEYTQNQAFRAMKKVIEANPDYAKDYKEQVAKLAAEGAKNEAMALKANKYLNMDTTTSTGSQTDPVIDSLTEGITFDLATGKGEVEGEQGEQRNGRPGSFELWSVGDLTDGEKGKNVKVLGGLVPGIDAAVARGILPVEPTLPELVDELVYTRLGGDPVLILNAKEEKPTYPFLSLLALLGAVAVVIVGARLKVHERIAKILLYDRPKTLAVAALVPLIFTPYTLLSGLILAAAAITIGVRSLLRRRMA